MAIPFVEHSYIGKAMQERPGTAVAHLRYITRKQATEYVGSNLTTNYHKLVRELTSREERTRKNGRVIDKLVIALPREMTIKQAVGTLHKFGKRMTKGRAWYLFSIQDWNQDNPHCHFILVDEDRETRKRVFGVSQRGSTAKIKHLWQDVANDDMAALGIDARIDFDAAEEKAEQRRQLEAENNNTLEPINTDNELEPPAETAEISDTETDEDAEMVVRVGQGVSLDEEERFRTALEFWEEHKYIEHAIQRRDDIAGRYETARAQAERASLEAAKAIQTTAYKEQALHYAMTRYDQTHSYSGRPKGLRLAIFGKTLWQSKTAKEASQARSDFDAAQSLYEYALQDKEELERTRKRLSNEADALLTQAKALERDVRVMGTDEELARAQEAYLNGIAEQVGDVKLETLMERMDAGDMTANQCREILTMLGREHDLATLEDYIAEKDEGVEI